jgi:hypothetical protein
MATINNDFIIKDDLVVSNEPARQLVIPHGPVEERPGTLVGSAAPRTGTIRYNTSLQVVEVYNGTIWQAASQVGEAVTYAQAEEISIVNAIVFG